MGRYRPRDLDHLDKTTITVDEKHSVIRSEIKGTLGKVFQAAGVAIPPALRTRLTAPRPYRVAGSQA